MSFSTVMMGQNDACDYLVEENNGIAVYHLPAPDFFVENMVNMEESERQVWVDRAKNQYKFDDMKFESEGSYVILTAKSSEDQDVIKKNIEQFASIMQRKTRKYNRAKAQKVRDTK